MSILRGLGAWAPGLNASFEADQYVYHVTWFTNLEGIAENGLEANPANAATPYRSGGGYAANSKGFVFYTEASGVRFWYSKYEDFANHLSDTPFEDGFVPVVLRVSNDAFEEDELEEDELGTRDAFNDAYKTRVDLAPDALEIWDGTAWLPLEDASIDIFLAGEEDKFEDDDGLEETHWVFRTHNPLLPNLD